MGSLSDLILHPRNGHTIAPGDVEAVNQLRSVIFALAIDLRRELDRDYLDRHGL